MDEKISQLSSLTNTTIATGDVIPVVDISASQTDKITYGNLLYPPDNIFGLFNASDPTKQAIFSLSGITTGNIRTLTLPDASTTLVGIDTTQTITNKTISTGTKINTSGSDGVGSLYYRDASGNLVPLAIGSSLQILNVTAGGLPAWVANPSSSTASTTVNGTVQIATTADITAGNSVGSTGAILVVPASAVGAPGNSKIVQYNSSGQYPAADGSLITNIPQFQPWTKISTQTISAVSLTTATLTQICAWTSLTGDTDDEYLIEFECACTSSGLSGGDVLVMRLNNDSNANHYATNIARNSATTTVNAYQDTTSAYFTMAISAANASLNLTFGSVKIKASKTIAGTSRNMLSDVTAGAGGVADMNFFRGAGGWSDTTSQITSIQFLFEQSSGSTQTISGLATLYKINR